MATTEPHRPTPTERLHEVTMAALHRAPIEPEHNIEISRNAKRETQFSVSVRGADLGNVLEQATKAYDRLAILYPYPTMNGSD